MLQSDTKTLTTLTAPDGWIWKENQVCIVLRDVRGELIIIIIIIVMMRMMMMLMPMMNNEALGQGKDIFIFILI